jgi:hypothetical protein
MPGHDIHELRRWAWLQVDKRGNGEALRKDMDRLKMKFNKFVDENTSIVTLIDKHRTRKTKGLEDSEMQSLLSVSQAKPHVRITTAFCLFVERTMHPRRRILSSTRHIMILDTLIFIMVLRVVFRSEA